MAKRQKRPSNRAITSKLAALTFDPKNARRHPERNLSMIQAALTEVGAGRSIVIDERARILAGEGAVRAARAAGFKRLRIVDTDRHTLVAVRRKDLTPAEKTRLALLDNRTGELAEWNPDVLQALAEAGVDLTTLWNPDELQTLLRSGSGHHGLTDPDDVPEPRRTSIRVGDLFELGRHRLLCGDSTSQEAVTAVFGSGPTPDLMVTDPPYGVDYDPTWRHRAGINTSARRDRVVNDDVVDWTAAWQLFPGPIAYVWHAARFGGAVAEQLHNVGFDVRAQIVWRKPRFVLSRGNYHWQHETCWYAVRRGHSGNWLGGRKQSTAWLVDVRGCPACGSLHAAVPVLAEGSSPAEAFTTVWDIPTKDDTGTTTHGTQKPVECFVRAARNHRASVLYEPFDGSGSGLIAAEILGLPCRAIEIAPVFVQMALDRWEAFTGQKAQKVGAVPRPKRRHG